MPRILVVSAVGQLGGAERSLAELTGAVNPDRFELFAAIGGPGPLSAELEGEGVRTQIVHMSRLQKTVNPIKIAEYVTTISRASRALADIIKALSIDIVHANSAMAHLYAGEASKRAGVPCIWHARDMSSLGPIGDRMADQATMVIAISEAVRDHLVRTGIEPKKVALVRNGVAMARIPEGSSRESIRSAARGDLGLDPLSFVAGSAGVFVPWKRHEDFIKAFSRICELEVEDQKTRPDGPGSTVVSLKGLIPARAVLFGEDLFEEHGRYVYDLRKLADELVGERIAFPGWRDDLPRLLPALDVFVSASENEPFGRVIVEAMAAGVPVVTTDSGGKTELVEHGKTGIVVPHGDVDALAEAVHLLRNNRKMRNEMSAAATHRAHELFSIDRAAREVEQVYESILGGSRPGESGRL